MNSKRAPTDTIPASGIDKLLADDDRLAALRQRRVGLLTNAACLTVDGRQSAQAVGDALAQGSGPGLACLFAPEHGPAADHEAGAAVADQRADQHDVISLYGARRAPTPDHLGLIDTLIIDLRDVGVRCYTYATTAALAAEAALDARVETIICNRLNPLGPVTFGPPLDPNFRSFLAYFDVPFVHGETIGTLVADAVKDHPRAADLTVIESDANPDTPWVLPSPSLQSPDAVQLYPGLVLFEGTNLSEGRGTKLPFRCIGAPWLDVQAAADAANNWPTGITATSCNIRPDAGDYAGQTLPAIRFDITDTRCDGFGLGVRLLAWISSTHPQFEWRTAPIMSLGAEAGQDTGERHVIDTLLGSDSLRLALGRGDSAEDILDPWRG
ncbi:MAG: DUF1343 domain-containing protein [Alphaproteobacteria bacterium]|nr:DUF1343 domain-containing protein [Alphaproteobacteria bacterium]